MKYTIGWIVISGWLAGCSKDAPPPQAPESAHDQAPAASQEQGPGASERIASVNISEDILRACGLTQKDAFFNYNSARVTPQADRILTSLAECFTTGPLKGRHVKLVGHADPRGDSEYNLVLGGRRADQVGDALAEKGVGEERLAASSRGEMDARGSDESTWAQDRRVDVLLGD